MPQNRRTFLQAIGAGSIATVGVTALSTPAAAATIITVKGGGADIWDTADAFHFYYEERSEDFDVRVHNTALERTSANAKTGIMARESLDPDAKNVMLRRLPDGSVSLQWRPESGAETLSTTSGGEDESEVADGSLSADWLRLTREGDTFSAYGSADGDDWTLIADLTAENLTFSADALVGIPVTSHNVGTLATAQHRDLSGLDPDTSTDVGDVEVTGHTTSEEGVPVVTTDATSDVTATSATFHGELSDLGEADSAEVYFEYREVPTDSWEATNRQTLTTTGSFSANVSGLTSRRYYDARAVVDTSDGDSATGSVLTVGTPSRSADGDGSDVSPGRAPFEPDDGFADPAPWLDDDTPMIVVTEPTRRQLEAATSVDGPRVVVFETSGTIDLGTQRLTVDTGQLYLAGQTAPSPGITLIRGGLWLTADDCVVQHVRVRPGDAGQPDGEGWEPDAIQTGDGTANNVVDHCTGTWSVDENINAGYDTTDTTISNCLIAEPLNDATHHKGEHGYNSIIGNQAKSVAYLGNTLAYATDRNPRLKEGTETVIVNNLVHHYHDGMWTDPDTEHSIVGNVFQWPTEDKPNIYGEGSVYADDNMLDWHAERAMVADSVTELDEPPLWPAGLDPIPTSEVKNTNLANAGARPADRTPQDERIIENIRTAGGSVIDSQDEVGGYPQLAENTRSVHVPQRETRTWLRRAARDVETRVAYGEPSTTDATVGERITFEVEDTSGDDRWITSLDWKFGDGTTATGWWAEHRYDEPGESHHGSPRTYTVELTATDNTGRTTTHEVLVTVSPLSKPVARAQPSTTDAAVGERIAFEIDDTSGDDRWITSLEWEFGDGTTATGWWAAHQYDASGTYTVELTATDNTGHTTKNTVVIDVS